MARRRKIPTYSNVGGIRGLAIKFVGAETAKRDLARLKPTIQKKLLRQGVASAARPVLKLARQYAKQTSAASTRSEGIGTTARALGMKVATSKRDAGVAYAIIGAKRGYFEYVTLMDRNKRSGVKEVSVPRRRRGGKVEHVPLKNLGPIARKARLSPQRQKDGTHAERIRRVPSRYLHLIDKGTRRSRAGKFMRWAAYNGRAESRAAFAENISAGLTREFAKLGQQ
jgi:hypothetical protein